MPAAKNSTREYRVWDQVEEEALRLGVKKHGLGAWERIRTDGEFSVLQSRSGVQLKDKWRNLVKFRHITPNETQQLQPKTSGPWHRKYASGGHGSSNGVGSRTAPSSASGSGSGHGAARKLPHVSRRKQSLARRVSELEEDDEDEEEEAAAVEAEMAAELGSDEEEGSKRAPRRKSARAAATTRRNYLEVEQALDADAGADDGDQDGAHDEDDADDPADGTHQRKKRRRVMPVQPDHRRLGVLDHPRYADDDAPRGAAGDSGDGSEHTDFEEQYVFECPCGITHDDGELMIECEQCKAWAHLACLQQHMAMDPFHNSFNVKNYICRRCQQWQRAAAAVAADNTNDDNSGSQSPIDPSKQQHRLQQPPSQVHHNPSSYHSDGGPHDQGAGGGGYGLGGYGGYLWGHGAGGSAEAGQGQQQSAEGQDMVDIDPVLTLILQGSLYVQRRRRGARRGGRWGGCMRQGWCSGFVDWEDIAASVEAAKQQLAAVGAVGLSGEDGRVRWHPAAIVEGHPKWQQQQQQQQQGEQQQQQGEQQQQQGDQELQQQQHGWEQQEEQEEEDEDGVDAAPIYKPIRRTGPHARSTLTDSLLMRSLLAHSAISSAYDAPSRAPGDAAGPSSTIVRTTARKGAFPRSSGVDQDVHKRASSLMRLPRPSRDRASMYLSEDDLGADAGDAVDAMLSVGVPPASPEHISHELFERVDREDEAADQQLHGSGGGVGHGEGKGVKPGGRWGRHQQQGSHDFDDLDDASRHTLDSLLLSSLTAGPSGHTNPGGMRPDLLPASLTPFMQAALGLNASVWPFAGLHSGTPPPSDLFQAPGSGNRGGAVRKSALGHSRLGPELPLDASLALHIAELRPPTPDTYALFRAPTPESMALQSVAALQPGGFSDISHPQSWPLSRTPPLPDGLLALHHSLTTMAAGPNSLHMAPPLVSSTAHSSAHLSASSLLTDHLALPLRRGAVAAAVKEEPQAVALPAPDLSTFFNIDEFVNQGPADEEAAEAMTAMAAALPAAGVRPPTQQQQELLPTGVVLT